MLLLFDLATLRATIFNLLASISIRIRMFCFMVKVASCEEVISRQNRCLNQWRGCIVDRQIIATDLIIEVAVKEVGIDIEYSCGGGSIRLDMTSELASRISSRNLYLMAIRNDHNQRKETGITSRIMVVLLSLLRRWKTLTIAPTYSMKLHNIIFHTSGSGPKRTRLQMAMISIPKGQIDSKRVVLAESLRSPWA